MPIYEYRCDPCDHTFETLIRGAGDAARCPQCGSLEVAKQLSVPAAAQTGRGRAGELPICGDSARRPSAAAARNAAAACARGWSRSPLVRPVTSAPSPRCAALPAVIEKSRSRCQTITTMATIAEAFAVAIQHHQAGRLLAAEQIYRQILQAEPDNADALHMLGIVNAQAGNHRMAVEYLHRALIARPHWAAAYANLGNILREQGKLDEAVASLQRALQLKPDNVAAHNNLGNAYESLGKLDEAIASYRRALELKPDLAEAHCNLGNVLKGRGGWTKRSPATAGPSSSGRTMPRRTTTWPSH